MSEERDLEKELKEARDQYEAENQEIYDEVTKGNNLGLNLPSNKSNKARTLSGATALPS